MDASKNSTVRTTAQTTANQPTGHTHALGLKQFKKHTGVRALIHDLHRMVSSVQLAITLLSTLALATLVGVLMPQEGLVELADIKRQFGESYLYLRALGLFNVFSSPWFIALQVLFFINLIFGSMLWLRPAVRSVFVPIFCSAQHIALTHGQAPPLTLPHSAQNTKSLLIQHLKRRGWRIVQDPKNTLQLYAAKGDYGRLGPVVAHIGIALLLTGSLLAALTGFKAQHLLEPGQTVMLPQAERVIKNAPEAIWLGHVPNIKLGVKQFNVEFNQSTPQDLKRGVSPTPKQYYCDIEVVTEDGQKIAQQISVNHPLTLGDITVYQATFAPTGKLSLEINHKPVTVNADRMFGDRAVAEVPVMVNRKPMTLIVFPFLVQQDAGVSAHHIRAFLHDGQGFYGLSKADAAKNRPVMPENLQLFEGESGTLGPVHVAFRAPVFASGLLIKKAPELPWMMLAFTLISLGVLMSLTPQRRLWLALQAANATDTTDATNAAQTTIYWLPKTRKAKLAYQKELEDLARALR
ncbi:MAG: cytochrome c biogenesis protein ResB [Vampirovibrionales bacterium]|nr:cytochrome c biogenesis protein ResB [Vampirovibrionales bacterium]